MTPLKTSRSGALLGALVLAAIAVPGALAQNAPTPTPNDTLVSPRILPDGRVVLSIYAPKAEEVMVGGDFSPTYAPIALTKDTDGVWSVTLGPLTPDFYSYSFHVDGVRTLDPKNATIKQGVSSVDNMFYLQGDETAFQDNRPVPHGTVRKVWYTSSTLDMQRRMHIYTPPGYDGDDDTYPVLYLLHGGGDEDSGWSTIGRAGFILDNLIAANQAEPMLVVMPNGSLPPPKDLPPYTPGTTPSAEFMAAMAEAQKRFTSELMNDVVPYVEAHYRVRPGPADRALAGLSMGGGQTLRVLVDHPDAFAYVGIWSAGLFRQTTEAFEQEHAAFLADPDAVNEYVHHLAITVGKDDFALEGSQRLADALTKHGIEARLTLTEGGHTWINWRNYLHDFAQVLFTDTPR